MPLNSKSIPINPHFLSELLVVAQAEIVKKLKQFLIKNYLLTISLGKKKEKFILLVVLSPRVSRFNCKHVQIVPLIRNRVLMVVVTVEGIAKNVEVTLSQNVDNEMALRLSNALNSMLKNIALQDFGTDMVDSIADLTRAETAVLREMLPVLQETLLEEETEVTATGFKNLLNYPEFNDVDKIKNLVDVVEAKPLLAKVMVNSITHTGDDRNQIIHISIGDENDNQHLKEFSIITSTYEMNGSPMGAFGVIGPTRMNYSLVSSVLDE